MACGKAICSFSPDQAEYFAYSSPDGCLKIWETGSNLLKQEYTPSAHLTSACSALSWAPPSCKQRADAISPKKRTKRSRSWNLASKICDLKLVAMGTLSGDTFLYSVKSGDLHSKLSDGHIDTVNGISWLVEEDAVFTCSSDQHIIRWSISEGIINSKWKAGQQPVHCICVMDSNNLLSASCSITWWDIRTQSSLKSFIGHATEVTCMLPVTLAENSANYHYFLSSAVSDRVINVWMLNENSDGSSVASFALSDEPVSIDVSENSVKSEPITMSAVTKSGLLHVFEHQLNGKIKKPIKPKSTVHIASTASGSEKSQPIPILSTKIYNGLDSCLVAYASFLKPVFEKLEFNLLENESYLIRKNPISLPSFSEGVSKLREPEVSQNTKILAPGYMAPAKPLENVSRKKKRKVATENEMPMEERLNAMHLSQAPGESETLSDSKPNADSMVHLLLQGLQSKDNKLLQTVLHNTDETLILNTVRKLPLHSVPTLLKELYRRLSGREQQNRPCLRWLRNVLAIHLSYLMSLQEIDELIGPLSQLIDAREATFPKMLQLKGFLDILWKQIDARTHHDPNIPTEPLFIYEDESSSAEEEDDIEEEMEHSDDNSPLENIDASESESEEEKGNGLPPDTDDELSDS